MDRSFRKLFTEYAWANKIGVGYKVKIGGVARVKEIKMDNQYPMLGTYNNEFEHDNCYYL